jgi:hypothetical protein
MIPELLSILGFAALFALFGVLRLRTGCSSDPSSCGRCTDACKKRDRADTT